MNRRRGEWPDPRRTRAACGANVWGVMYLTPSDLYGAGRENIFDPGEARPNHYT